MMKVASLFDPWKSSLCTCPPKYSLSPYTACNHGCQYCYISSYVPRAFESRVKEDFLKRLQSDLPLLERNRVVSIANSSDPYVSLEVAEKLTRSTLELLLNHGLMVQIITKSDLIIRDLDILRKGKCCVNITITTINDALAEDLEPGAPPPSKRLAALKKLTDADIPCSVRIDPLIPRINEKDIGQVVEAVSKCGASHVTGSTYKARPDNFHRVTETFPETREELTNLYRQGSKVHSTSYLPKTLRVKILTELREMVLRNGMTFAVCREGLPDLNSKGTNCDGTHLIHRASE